LFYTVFTDAQGETMTSKLAFAVMVVTFGVVGAFSISAQETTTATSQWGGIYTVAQADRGQTIYETKCSNCHLKSMYGHADDEASPEQPGLTGEEFWQHWEGSSLGMLFDVIAKTMPRDDPGTLTSQDVSDIIAHILRVNKAPEGAAELPASADALNKIKLIEKKPA
jgi:cytochrome c